MECWKCHEQAERRALCARCGAIQPPGGAIDHFALLGLEREYFVERELLDGRYRELQRALHPDRFAKASPRERLASVQQTTSVNEAYRTLKEPVRRAEYLLRLAGIDVAEEKPGGEKVDPALLVSMLELREALAEAQAAGRAAEVERLVNEVSAQRDQAMRGVEEGFRASGGLPDRATAETIARHLVALRYYRRFLDEAEGRGAEI